MKVLWVNPSFLDYRIPFYAELNYLCQGQFHLAYSINRIPQRCTDRIRSVLGDNAHGLQTERALKLTNHKTDFANKGICLPYPKGLGHMLAGIQADIIVGEGFFQWTPWALKKALHDKSVFLLAYERTKHSERYCSPLRKLYRKSIGHFVKGFLLNGSLSEQYVSHLCSRSIPVVTGIMAADSKKLADLTAKITEEEIAALKKQLSLDAGLTYLFVGRYIVRKGIAQLLESWKTHRQLHQQDNLVLVGDGPLWTEYQERFGTFPGIKMIGAIPYDDIHRYYAMADVFVIPTLEDNWSLVVPEAMACGLPIATSLYNGCYPELVQAGENGCIFDPLTPASLLQALESFHHVDLISMGRRSIEIEKEYTPEKCAVRAFDFFKQFIR